MAARSRADEEGRIRRSWRLSGIAWRIARRDLTLIGLGLASVLAGILGLAAFFAFGGYFVDLEAEGVTRLNVVGFGAHFAWFFIGAFLSVAFASASAAALDGRPATLDEALGFAGERAGTICFYALIATAADVAIKVLLVRSIGAATFFLGVAWSLLVFFVAPAIALEERGAVSAIGRSAAVMRRRLGEVIGGSFAIGAFGFLAMVGAGIAVAIAVALAKGNTAAEVIVICCAIGIVTAIYAMAHAVKEVFIVSLFRFGTGGDGALGAAAAEVETPFVERKRLIRPWLAVLAAGLIALIVVAAIVHKPERQAPAYGTVPARYVVPFPLHDRHLLRPGVGLYWGHQLAGEVEVVKPWRHRLLARIRVEPRFLSLVRQTRLHLFRSKRRVWLAMIRAR